MHIEAYPMRFVAISDGVRDDREHVVLFLEHARGGEPCGFALGLGEARLLLEALNAILPSIQQIQTDITNTN